MANGVRTNNITNKVSVADELMVNRDGSTGAQSVVDLATQLAGTGALADRLAGLDEDIASINTGDSITKATWAELHANVGDRSGQRGYVENDGGTHTDPVLGVVDNKGVYGWSPFYEDWLWMRSNDYDQIAADLADTVEAQFADKVTTQEVDLGTGRIISANGLTMLVTGDGLALLGFDTNGALLAKAGDWAVKSLVYGQSGNDRSKTIETTAKSLIVTTDGLEVLGIDGHKLRFVPSDLTAQLMAIANGLGAAPVSPTDIICIGDSLTQGAGSTGGLTYPAQLAAITGRSVSMLAYGGQTSAQVGAIWGSNRIHLTVTGGSIPASGGVAVTSDTDILVLGGIYQTTYQARGTIAGVDGMLTTDTSGNYTFTRSAAGDAVLVDNSNNLFVLSDQAGSGFIPLRGLHYGKTLIGCLGRNGDKTTHLKRVGMLDDVIRITQRLNSRYPNYYWLSVPNNNTEPIGSAGYDDVLELNELFRSAFGERYIDWRSYLINYGLYDAGLEATAQDLTDIANDIVPSSFRADLVHLNNTGYQLMAQFVAENIR